MVRVAGLLGRPRPGIGVRSADGRTPQVALADIRERVIELRARQSSCGGTTSCRRCAPRASRSARRGLHGGRAGERSATVRARGLPGADAARRRAGPAVPVHLRALAQPRRAGARPGHRRGAVRPGEGARRCCRGSSGRRRAGTRLVPLEEVIAHFLPSALPGDGDRRAAPRSASPAMPTSRSRTRPTTCSRPSRSSCAGAGSATSCGVEVADDMIEARCCSG